MSRKIRKFRTEKFDACNKRNFDSCNSCKRLRTSRLHELHESKFMFVSRIEFIHSKLSNLSAHVSGAITTAAGDYSPHGPPRAVSQGGAVTAPRGSVRSTTRSQWSHGRTGVAAAGAVTRVQRGRAVIHRHKQTPVDRSASAAQLSVCPVSSQRGSDSPVPSQRPARP